MNPAIDTANYRSFAILNLGLPTGANDTIVGMRLTIELDREVYGRWIAEVPELNIILYGDSRQDAIQ